MANLLSVLCIWAIMCIWGILVGVGWMLCMTHCPSCYVSMNLEQT